MVEAKMSEKPMPKVGVGMLIVRDGKVLMGLRKGAHGEGHWAPSGGHLEFGESVEDCGRREAKEETGIDIGQVNVIGFTNDIFSTEGKHYITIYCRAFVGKEVEPKNMEPDKCERWEWLDWDHLPENIFLPIKNAKKQGIDPRG